jgi:hypothetical protein
VDKNIITRALSPTYARTQNLDVYDVRGSLSHYLRETHSRKRISARPLCPPDFIVIESDICPHPAVLPATFAAKCFWSGTPAAIAGERDRTAFSAPCMHLGF